MDVFDLRTVRKQISHLLELGATDSRVLQTLRYQTGLIPQETELWDYKSALGADPLSVVGSILYIVSFYNTFGGFLIYGVDEREAGAPAAIVGVSAIPNQHQLRDLVRSYTGHSVALTVGVASMVADGPQLAIVHVPKRPLDQPPVAFGKNGPDEKPGKPLFLKETAYFRDLDQSVPIRTRDHWGLVFGPRRNPHLWDFADPIGASPTLDHNLPDQNVIFPWFIGREAILNDLWRWLANPFAYLKLLVGDGGKGKTSIAYEFGRQTCTLPPLGLERVLWLSAKRRRFVGQVDAYVPMPEIHFSDTSSFLQRLAGHMAVTTAESVDASDTLLKQLIRDAFQHIPTLLIVDDVDSLTVEEQKVFLSVLQQLACHRGRILVTTRMNFAFGPDMAVSVGGLDRDEFLAFANRLSTSFGTTLKPGQITTLHAVTEGSPLFTESLLRLVKQGMTFDAAIREWKGKLGAEARNAALMKEVKLLSAESRRVLLACAMLESASVSELRVVVEYVDQRMQSCIAELRSMFLLSQDKFIEGEHRYSVSQNTQNLVLETASSLCNDPEGLERRAGQLLRLRRGAEKVKAVGLAISQAIALLKEERFDDARGTLGSALESHPNNGDLLSTIALCLLAEGQATRDGRKLQDARDECLRSYRQGQRKAKMFEIWYDAELALEHWAGAEEVGRLAIGHGIEPLATWFHRRANAQVALADQQIAASALDLADRKLKEAGDDLAAAMGLAAGAERIGFCRLLGDVHDRQWVLIRRRGSGVAELKLGSDALKRFVERGDIRRENGVRLIELLDYLLEAVRSRRSRRRGFVNLVMQIIRQSEMTAARIRGDNSTDEGWTALSEQSVRLKGELIAALGVDTNDEGAFA